MAMNPQECIPEDRWVFSLSSSLPFLQASSTRPECSIMQEIEEERSQCLAEIVRDNQTSGMGSLLPSLACKATSPSLTSALSMSFLTPSAAGAGQSPQMMLSSYVRRERKRYFQSTIQSTESLNSSLGITCCLPAG